MADRIGIERCRVNAARPAPAGRRLYPRDGPVINSAAQCVVSLSADRARIAAKDDLGRAPGTWLDAS